MQTHRRFLVTLFALAAAVPAVARPGHGEFGGGPGFGMGFLKKLDLSADQKAKLKEIRQGGKDQMKSLREAAKQSRQALKDAMAGNADDGKLTALFADSQAKHQAMVSFGFQQLLKVRAILTPDQRAKVRSLIEEHQGGWHGGKHDDEE